jgi:regulatory protein SWI5
LIDYFPPTPATTPFNRVQKSEPVVQRFLDDYDTSMEDTIKPARERTNQRTRNIFQEMREQAEMRAPPSPPSTAHLPSSSKFDSAPMPTSDFLNMSNINMDFKIENGYESSQFSPTASNRSPEVSQRSSPEMSQMPMFVDAFESRPHLEAIEESRYKYSSSSPVNPEHGFSSEAGSPRGQSQTLDGIDLEETITDTGITIDDIACYIDGPDPADQKWTCLFPECKKRFGRKENIKSHVQTHLGDRQYQCPHCKKCFVRQHDLKRHAKIHSGVKPYPCACGNSFARHDALTRHRQRGMCIGAFEGVVKKVVKRGRPRKTRPDIEERLDKASRTRSKNKDKAMSSASSTSCYSESSYGLSPPGDFDILDDKPFTDFTNDYSQGGLFVEDSQFPYSSVPSPARVDYVSPQAIQNAPSPSAFSTHSDQSHYSFHSATSNQHQHLAPPRASPTKSTASVSHYASSPPSLPNNQVYDLSISDDMDLTKLAALSEHDDEMFLDAFALGDLGATRLEQDPGCLLMSGKYDDAFGEWDSWSS